MAHDRAKWNARFKLLRRCRWLSGVSISFEASDGRVIHMTWGNGVQIRIEEPCATS